MAVSPESITRSSSKSKRVLLAEDCFDTSLLLSHLFASIGVEVIAVTNGRACVDAALHANKSSNPFDLIVLDIQMPFINGNDAAREIRASGFKGPIIAFTSSASDVGHEESKLAGINFYFSKDKIRRTFLEDLVAEHCT